VIVCKSPAELERMRAANALVADVLAELAGMVAPGITTKDLDAAAADDLALVTNLFHRRSDLHSSIPNP
jgi:methionine aminopeptidase